MSGEISRSTNAFDYEILIRKRGENDYASYCPQLNYMIKGTEHEEVRILMKALIEKYIQKIQSEQDMDGGAAGPDENE